MHGYQDSRRSQELQEKTLDQLQYQHRTIKEIGEAVGRAEKSLDLLVYCAFLAVCLLTILALGGFSEAVDVIRSLDG